MFIQAGNPHWDFGFRPALRDWPIERNGAGLEKVADEPHAGEDGLPARAEARGDGFLPRPDDAALPALRAVSGRAGGHGCQPAAFSAFPLGRGSRDFRNRIRPHERTIPGFTPEEHTARARFPVPRAAPARLAGERP